MADVRAQQEEADGAQDVAASAAPPCMARDRQLPIDNEQVLTWKDTTPNQFKARAHISGTLIREYADASGHGHMKVQIGSRPTDTIEGIYNEDFGALPDKIEPGSKIEACGDYITSNAPAGHYKASPDGAIIHWVHRSPRPQQHDSGYYAINGVVYGLGQDHGVERGSPHCKKGDRCQDDKKRQPTTGDQRRADRRAELGPDADQFFDRAAGEAN